MASWAFGIAQNVVLRHRHVAIGLMTDAGMRLFCAIDQPFHVIAAHGGVILLGAAGGALTATLIERVKYRRLQVRRGLDARGS